MGNSNMGKSFIKQGIVRQSLFGLLFASFTLVGCAAGVGYYAPSAPPPIRVEAYGAAPGPGYVWVNGYWGWRGGNYEWVRGNWVRPPHARAVWVAPRWEHDRGRYRFHEGHWR